MSRRSITPEEADSELRGRAANVTDDDVEHVIRNTHRIEDLFRSQGSLMKLFDDVKILMSLVKDYYNGVYREIPWMSIAAVVAALIYVLSPIDLIPDYIPVIGFVDDAAVVTACIALIRKDLEKYRQWKAENPDTKPV